VTQRLALYGQVAACGDSVAANDASTSAANCCQAVRPFRAIRSDSHVHMRPHSYRAASDSCASRRMGCASNGNRKAFALLSMWQAQMYRDSATRDEAGWLRVGPLKRSPVIHEPSPI
jgi:hypothetical protein